MDKVLERDQKLSELDDRADALQAGASQFETSAAKLKRKYWWKNCKVIMACTLKIFRITTNSFSNGRSNRDFSQCYLLQHLVLKHRSG